MCQAQAAGWKHAVRVKSVLVIGLSAAAAVVTVAITALGIILYYWRRHRARCGVLAS